MNVMKTYNKKNWSYELEKKITEKMALSPESITRRLRFLRFSKEDYGLLRKYQTWLQSIVPSLLDTFNDHLPQHRKIELKLINSAFPNHLGRNFTEHFTQMFSGEFSSEHIARCIQVSIKHQQSNITQEHYISMYSWLLGETIKRILEASDLNENDKKNLCQSIIKVFSFDIGLVMETYNHVGLAQIAHLANHDTLTGLPNHNLLIETLEKMLSENNPDTPIQVYFSGIDRFKAVNETMGHPVGDRLLIEVADRLRRMTPPEWLVSRFGADIFVIVVQDDVINSQPEIFSNRIRRVVSEPLDLEGISVDVDITTGVAVCMGRDTDASTLVREAEMAMYDAKQRQVNCTVYNQKMARFSMTQLGLGAELRRAIDNDELVLFYQPKVDARTKQVSGVEALIRWFHPVRGFMPPGLFIPYAESTAIIHPLTDWVLEEAIRQASAWRNQNLSLHVSVNLAAANLQNHSLSGHIGELLAKYQLPPELLVLEITESGLMIEPEKAAAQSRIFREMGLVLSIDDFGTGYSSLAYLKDLPVHELKIDRSFILNMLSEPKSRQIVTATIGLGHAMDLQVTAEGVEDERTGQLLKEMGCDRIQGYHYSRPLPADEFEEWLANYTSIPVPLLDDTFRELPPATTS